MVRWLTSWIRTTFDYNPAFPLSALALMVGLRILAADGTLAAVTVAVGTDCALPHPAARIVVSIRQVTARSRLCCILSHSSSTLQRISSLTSEAIR